MNKIMKKVTTILLVLVMIITGCDNAPSTLVDITVEQPATTVNIPDGATSVSLPTARIVASFSNGETREVTATYSATVKDNISGKASVTNGMTANGKGVYTVTASYSEGGITASKSYDVTVTGAPVLLIESLSGTDELYNGSTAANVKAVVKYENEEGRTSDVSNDAKLTVKNTEGTEQETSDILQVAGTYTLVATYNNLKAEMTFLVTEDIPYSITLSAGDSITTSYKQTDATFEYSLSNTYTVTYKSGKTESNVALSSFTFKIGEKTITSGAEITAEDEGKTIDIYYKDTDEKEGKVYSSAAIDYIPVTSITATTDVTGTLPFVATSDNLDFSTLSSHVTNVALGFDDNSSETISTGYSITNTKVSDGIRPTYSIGIKSDTYNVSSEIFKVQIVQNKYEEAAYSKITSTFSANSENPIELTYTYNLVDNDNTDLLFLGYFDEKGNAVAYVGANDTAPESGVYITTSSAVSGTKTVTGYAGENSTEISVPTGYAITNTLHNTTGESVTLHMILAPASEYTISSGSKTIDSAIVGIPASITSIPDEAFKDNKNIKAVVFEVGSQLTTIGTSAFQNSSVEYVDVPSSLTTLNNFAFNGSQLRYFDLDSSTTLNTLGAQSLAGTQMVNVYIPTSVTSISNETFFNNNVLENFIFADGGTAAITMPVLLNCRSIKLVYVPENVTIGNTSFNNSTIETVLIVGQKSKSTFGTQASDWSVPNEPATITNILWTVEDQVSAVASNYSTYVFEPGESFTATIQKYDADSNVVGEPITGVSFTVPSDVTIGADVTFECDYQYDETTTVKVSFTGRVVAAGTKAPSATATDYSTTLFAQGETFTATVQKYNENGVADGSPEAGVSFTVPENATVGENVTFECDYKYDEATTVKVSFTGRVLEKDSKITDEATLTAFLNSTATTGYVLNDIQTAGFTIPKGKTITGTLVTANPTISVTSIVADSNAAIVVNSEGDGSVKLEKVNITYTGTSATSNYLIDATGVTSFDLDTVKLTSSVDIGGCLYMKNSSGTLTAVSTEGTGVPLVPLWFDGGCTVNVNSCDISVENSGPYGWAHIMITNAGNKITIGENTKNFVRYAIGPNASTDDIDFDSTIGWLVDKTKVASSQGGIPEGYTVYVPSEA